MICELIRQIQLRDPLIHLRNRYLQECGNGWHFFEDIHDFVLSAIKVDPFELCTRRHDVASIHIC